MAFTNVKQANDAIQALRSQYDGIKHIDQILTAEEKAQVRQWFQQWNQFYIQYQDQTLNKATLDKVFEGYAKQKTGVDRWLKLDKQIDEQEKQSRVQISEEILSQQEQIEREEQERYERQKQLEQQEKIDEQERKKASQVKIPTRGTGDYQSLAASWNAVIDLWDRIATLPAEHVVTTVNNSINRWLDFYEGQVVEFYTLGKAVPDYLTNQIGTWVDLYNKTKKVVETAAAQSDILSQAPTAGALPIESVKLAPGMVYDPKTGVIHAPEIAITGQVPGVTPKSVPKGVYSLPPPVIPAPEPIYKPPPTIIIKQIIPPEQPKVPSIDPNQPMIFEPGIRTLGDIPGGGLVEPKVSDDTDDPFEEISETVSSNWPWLLGLGVVVFLAKTR